MSDVFLTGASGFLGGHLLRELAAAGHRVRALSRRPRTDAAIAALGGTPVRASLADAHQLQRAMEGCEAVFHAAADTSLWRPGAAAQLATNVGGTIQLLRAAERARVRAFMHTSSVSAYSHLVRGTMTETTPQRGGESWITYERSKYLGEQAVRDSALPWIVFNPSHILGPGDRNNWSRLIRLVDAQKLPGIPPGIGAFADVREIARAQVRAWQRSCFGEAYLLGGEQASFVDFVHRVGTALGRRTPRGATPAWLLMGYARVLDALSRLSRREPDVTPEGAALTSHRLQVDSGKAKRELDYLETPLDILLADTLAWMRTEGMLR
ncbi:NAD-dependent epimerase/dehydratase family protein [Dyella sp.]|jgi:nucleoside-diphosphate-sugar epimerase|uniref:NAD-dependent epimerase/dehydratase family protein n=1 Tax=Dyella sp. TaxID=1869338 RepID=UPI002D77776A|nr:NAD-dependent epimerase/dehydratase family protein [Dyella sp.]HET6432768.1 NAD-dependent epimerase/dehydratase family protein [Dyella sp.]